MDPDGPEPVSAVWQPIAGIKPGHRPLPTGGLVRSKFITDEDVERETRRRISNNPGPSLRFPKDPDPICAPIPCEGWKLAFWKAVESEK